MALLALVAGGDVVGAAAERDVPAGRHGGGRLIVVPGVDRVDPEAVTHLLPEAGLDPAAVLDELLPQLGADGENPLVRLRGVDGGPRRQPDPAVLVGAV